MDHNAQGRRPHYNRGRRGPDRRGAERRAPQQQEQAARSSSEQVDVEQIMREIRARIAQRHGIELSNPQIQELAARRLEAILDPRGVNPALMEQLRRSAAAPAEVAPATPDPGYTFEDTTLFETHRGVLRFIRRLLNPILKLFFNPNPLVHALHTQSRLNREAAARELERERQQAEWNALHYEVLQRMVMEVSRVSVEMQSLSARIESLSTKVDFNERRVRSLEKENTGAGGRPQRPVVEQAPPPAAASGETIAAEPAATAEGTPGDGSRRRRRRRGRRSGAPGAEVGDAAAAAGAGAAAESGLDALDGDDGDEDERGEPADVPPPPLEAPQRSHVSQPATETAVETSSQTPMLAEAESVVEPPRQPEVAAETFAAPASEPSPGAPPLHTERAVDERLDAPPQFTEPAAPQALQPMSPQPTAVQPAEPRPAAPEPATPQPAPPRDEPAPQAPADTADPGPPDR